MAEEAVGQRTALAGENEEDWARVMVAFELMLVKFLLGGEKNTRQINYLK